MAIYSSAPEVLPSLVFTKAELSYILTRLTSDIDPSDNETGLEMVELRHYCTLIADNIAAAAKKGELSLKAVELPKKDEHRQTAAKIAELRKQFPTLTEAEIADVVERAKRERGESESEPPPKPPAFVVKREMDENTPKARKPSGGILDEKSERDAENTKKFASMLNGI